MRPLLSIRKVKRLQPDNARNLQKAPHPQPKRTEGGSCWVIGGGMRISKALLAKVIGSGEEIKPRRMNG